MNNRSTVVLDAATLLLSASFAVGMKTFLAACGPHEDGAWMSCHWAEAALFALAVVLTVQAAIRLALRAPGAKRGAALAMLPVALAAAIVPGGLIPLCMMRTMRCQMVMKPGATVFAVLIAALCAVEALLLRKSER